MALSSEAQQKIDSLGLENQGVNIVDAEGAVVENVPRGTNKIVGTGQKVYSTTDASGNRVYSADISQLPASITLDDNTGKITIKAPQSFFDSEVYEQNFSDTALQGLTALYRQNKDAKVQMSDGSKKTVKELIETWNEKLPDLVGGWLDYSNKKENIGKRFGEDDKQKFTLETYQIMGTSAYSGKGDDLLVIPNSLLSGRWSFFKDLPGFDSKTNTIPFKNFREGYYHLSAHRDLTEDTGIAALKKDAAKALSGYSGGDVKEFARLIAFNNFLSGRGAEGADLSPESDFGNELVVGGYAVGEGAMRAVMRTGVDLINTVSNAILVPFSAVDWAGALATTGESRWEWVNIIDKTMGLMNRLSGGDDFSVFGYETVDQIMDAEYAKRGDFYNLTNAAVSTAYTLTYTASSIAIRFMQTKALNNLVLNTAALGISKISLGKTVSAVAEQLGGTGIITETGQKLTSRQIVYEKVRDVLLDGGTSENVVNLLTGSGDLSFRQTMNLLTSMNPADFINATYQWSGLVNAAGEYLRSGATENINAFAEWFRNSGAVASAAGDWKTYAEIASQYKKYNEVLSQIYLVGNNLAITSAKTLATLKNYARFVPALYYTSQVIVGTYLTESDNIKKLIQGVDSAEERDIIWGMVGRAITGWTIGTVLGWAWNAVKSGFATPAVERANARTTEKIAKVQTAVSGRINQVHELLSGKDWIDSTKDPIKKSVLKYNQSLQKSQEYMATAADTVRAAGGTEAEATTATLTAMNQMRANQNAIDLMQNVDLVVGAWHTPAYPAYASAVQAFTETDKALIDMLDKAGHGNNVETTAMIGGVATNGGLPQDLANYMNRALQRASYLRDDISFDSAVATQSELKEYAGTIEYTITDQRFLRERQIAIQYMAELETSGKYPKELLDYIKQTWVPAAQSAMYQLNQIEIAAGYDLRSRTLGWRQSGMFGKNNELYFPTQRVTQAQKDFEEAVRNPMEVSRRGAVKRNFYNPEHYVPGSEENTDFVHPMTVFRKVEHQKAVDYAVNEFKKANLSNPLVKNETKLDGTHTGAAKTYEDLKPTFDRAVKSGFSSARETLEGSSIIENMFDKNKVEKQVRNLETKIKAAQKKVNAIPDMEVRVSRADKLDVINRLSEDELDDLLEATGVNLGSMVEFSFENTPSYDEFIQNELVGEMNPDQKVQKALREYQVGDAKQLNEFLSGIRTAGPLKSMANDLARAFTQKLRRDTILFSGDMEETYRELLTTGRQTASGIFSASTNPAYARVFPSGSGSKVLLRVRAYAGSSVTRHAENVRAAAGMKEDEIAFAPNLEIRLLREYKVGEVKFPGLDLSDRKVIDVEIGEQKGERLGLDEKRMLLKNELERRCG